MRPEELEEIRKRAGVATAGPWGWAKYSLDEDDWDTEMPWLGNATEAVMDFGDCEQYYPTEGTPPNVADAEFIANAREDVPKLLAEIERLRKELAFIANVDLVKNAYDKEHIAVSVQSWALNVLDGVNHDGTKA